MVKITRMVLILMIMVLIFQTILILDLNGTIKDLKQELNTTKTKLEKKINENYIQTQDQLNQLTSTLIKTQENLREQISELKAGTSEDFSGIIEEVVKGVVSIKTDVSQGSGFIISKDGYIVTNAHVLSNAGYIKALTYKNELENAELVGYNLNLDLALLKIKGNFEYLEFADSDDVKVGEKVIAIGNPYGLSFTVTEGIVSAKDRKGFNNLPYYIQTDVPLNPGNSGGPLVNKKGEAVGINNFKVGGAESLGFALASDYVVAAINQILSQALNQTIL
jgi:S1-C subfamily serine protease